MPKSLSELNNYSSGGYNYTDLRPYTLTFSGNAVNQSITVVEDQAWSSPVGTNITEGFSYPGNVTYNVNLSNLSATIGNVGFNWGNVPSYLTVSNPSTGVYRVTGLITETEWDIIKNPTITVKDQATSFIYNANIQYPNLANVANTAVSSWTVSVAVTAQDEWGTANNQGYITNTAIGVQAPAIIDQYPGTANYTVVMTPNTTSAVSSFTSLSNVANVTFNTGTKVLTIVGDKSNVNAVLNGNIVYTPATGYNSNFTVQYGLTNPVSGLNTNTTQNFNNVGVATITANNYDEDVPFNTGFIITETSTLVSSYTVQIAQASPNPATTPGQFLIDGSNVGTTWNITDTKANINAKSVYFNPPVDYTGTIVLNLSVSKVVSGNVVVETTNAPFNVYINTTNSEVANVNAINYTANTYNASIFGASPITILDGPYSGHTYTVSLATAEGSFVNGTTGANAVINSGVTTFTMTDSKANINAVLANVGFVPKFGSTGANTTYNYTQSRNGVTQANLTAALNGTASAFAGTGTFTFTSNGTFTPTLEQRLFGNTRILMVGGGGGGAKPGGGGGGGGVATLTRNSASSQSGTRLDETYTVTIGQGGTGVSAVTTPPGINYNATADGGQPTTISSSSGTPSVAGGGGGRARYQVSNPEGSRYIDSTGGGSGSGSYTGGNGADFAAGGGGAGAGGNGGNAQAGTPGTGVAVSGFTGRYSGGGGGNGYSGARVDGGGTNLSAQVDGNANSGGGGAGRSVNTPGNGGSGIVIFSIT